VDLLGGLSQKGQQGVVVERGDATCDLSLTTNPDPAPFRSLPTAPLAPGLGEDTPLTSHYAVCFTLLPGQCFLMVRGLGTLLAG